MYKYISVGAPRNVFLGFYANCALLLALWALTVAASTWIVYLQTVMILLISESL